MGSCRSLMSVSCATAFPMAGATRGTDVCPTPTGGLSLGISSTCIAGVSRTGRIPQQLEPELHWIDPTFLGDLVQKGFGHEGAGGEADTSERRCAYSRIAIEQLSPLIGNVIAVKVHAGHQDEVFAASQFVKTHIRKRRHAVASQPMVPCDQLARGVQPGADVMRGDRAEASVADIVSARPQHLDRCAGLLR